MAKAEWIFAPEENRLVIIHGDYTISLSWEEAEDLEQELSHVLLARAGREPEKPH